MPLARSDESSPTIGESATDPEFARVLRISDPGMALDGPLTFGPVAGSTLPVWMAEWKRWRDQTLAPELSRVLASVAHHAEGGHAREIQTLDLALEASLDPLISARSKAAGGRLLYRLSGLRGERWLAKLQTWRAAGETPGHFPVVYAAQSALFHLPLRLLVPSYAYWEWCSAMTSCPPAGRPLPDFSRETSDLRRLAEETLSSHASHAAENFHAATGGS